MRWRRSGRTLALIALLAGCRDGFTAVPVTASGVAPLAHAGTGSTHLVGAMVELDARGSFDPDGTLTSFRWSVFAKPPGSAATLHDDSASTSSVVLDKVGSYTFDVEVTDDDGLIDTSRVTFVADPPKITVDAGSNAATLWRTNVALSGSYDVEGGFPATVSWSFASKPAGSLATLANAATLTPSFEPDAEGTFVARLTVKTAHATASDDVEIAASIPRQVLAYDVVDAEYSSALDKIVMVTRNPSRMLMHDPATNTTITIVLAASPRSLSLAPDGLRAVVGFDSFVSTVDLQTQAQSAAISIPATISDVVYAADNRVHVFPQGQWANLYTVALATGTITTATNGHLVRGGSRGRLHPDGQKLYFQTTRG